MANQETAFGLRPIGLVGNGANSTGVTQYEIASNNTNPIFQFSLCVPTAAGVIDHAGATSGGTTPALGVLMGVEYVDSGTKKVVFKNYWPGSNNVSVDTNFPVKAFVADNPNQLFMVAADGSSTDRATALSNILLTCHWQTALPVQQQPVVQPPKWIFPLSLLQLRCSCALLASQVMMLTSTMMRQV